MKTRINLEALAHAACQAAGIPRLDADASSRDFAYARHAFCFLAHQQGIKYLAIAPYVGRSLSNVGRSVIVATNLLSYPDFSSLLDKIKQNYQNNTK